MSLQKFHLQAKGISLAVGMAFLLGQTSAMAAPRNQYDGSNPSDVVVDTEGGTSGSSSSGNGSSNPIYDRNTRFGCQSYNGEYTVMYFPESQPEQAFPWATPASLGGGWNSQRRCNEIARRLELYRPDGLVELTTDVENGYNTICVTTEQVPTCRIVLTVPPGQDPIVTRDRVFENLTVADSGGQTEGVYTYRGGRGNSQVDRLLNVGRSVLGGKKQFSAKSINLRPFLDRADGGTGAKLSNGIPAKKSGATPARNNRKLNPGSFR
ncbi:COP23 domain-containing protein [Aliterella atlantica]|uniref:Circadian oscillating protein COP23 n=1 Tax=Aliterella atlantica CENA595 TaxID=1618023 RepID=A0A0D8ZZ16_9CYAN|nr:COP23 domain-containing protein [Aliterella atlantica]KJH72456.1 hypothetical protein UH38_06730 [Aliterella atlantica CENA595]